MPRRRRARIVAFQILYSINYTGFDLQEAARCYYQLEPDRKTPFPRFVHDLAKAVLDHRDQVNELIAGSLVHWLPERLGATERILLQMACAEFLFFNDIPPRVTLDEYIDLAREFGDEDAYRFVNGVLDSILKHLPSESATDNAPGAEVVPPVTETVEAESNPTGNSASGESASAPAQGDEESNIPAN